MIVEVVQSAQVSTLGPRLSRTVPALPVQDTDKAAAFCQQRLGFVVRYVDDGFARRSR